MSILKKSIQFLGKDNMLPLLSGLVSGLYPWAFYYTKNFNFVNSWAHFYYFLIAFLMLPIGANYLLYFLLRGKHLIKYKTFILPLLNAFVFFLLVAVALYARVGKKRLVLIVFLAFAVAIACYYIKKLFTKILVVQFLLLITTTYGLVDITKRYLFQSDEWLIQPDAIEQVVFKKKPNVYVIQPDGYVNFTELSRGYYQYDNSEFEQWLWDNDFVLYPDFRSNYFSTLSSNSSMFAMKHHHYEQWDERKTIMDINPVVKIFNNNDYTTHFFAEVPYLLSNRPEISFDYTNIRMREVPYLSRGLRVNRNILTDLEPVIENQKGSNFYFFEKLMPGHISVYKDIAKSYEEERQKYLGKLDEANEWLKNLIAVILKNDPDALIVIVADHGGYVGWEYSRQASTKTDDRDLLYSAFSTMLAIKWSDDLEPEFDHEFKTSINLFRILIAHLAEDTSYLEHLQEDTSYINIEHGAPPGTYKVIDGEGNIVFERYD